MFKIFSGLSLTARSAILITDHLHYQIQDGSESLICAKGFPSLKRSWLTYTFNHGSLSAKLIEKQAYLNQKKFTFPALRISDPIRADLSTPDLTVLLDLAKKSAPTFTYIYLDLGSKEIECYSYDQHEWIIQYKPRDCIIAANTNEIKLSASEPTILNAEVTS